MPSFSDRTAPDRPFDPLDSSAWLTLAEAHNTRGDASEVESALRLAIAAALLATGRIVPGREPAASLAALGFHLLRAGQPTEAERAFRHALANRRTCTAAFFGLAQLARGAEKTQS